MRLQAFTNSASFRSLKLSLNHSERLHALRRTVCIAPVIATMVPTPNRLDSVEVHNGSAATVTITVTFNDAVKDKKDITETAEIAAGGSHHFEEKSIDMGSWSAVAPVSKVELAHEAHVHLLEPGVQGIVKKLKIAVSPEFQLVQGAAE